MFLLREGVELRVHLVIRIPCADVDDLSTGALLLLLSAGTRAGTTAAACSADSGGVGFGLDVAAHDGGWRGLEKGKRAGETGTRSDREAADGRATARREETTRSTRECGAWADRTVC
jgi:hypothetical protein